MTELETVLPEVSRWVYAHMSAPIKLPPTPCNLGYRRVTRVLDRVVQRVIDQHGDRRDQEIPDLVSLLMVVISPWVNLRLARFWHSPETFDPDRFASVLAKCRDAYQYLPFGGAPHVHWQAPHAVRDQARNGGDLPALSARARAARPRQACTAGVTHTRRADLGAARAAWSGRRRMSKVVVVTGTSSGIGRADVAWRQRLRRLLLERIYQRLVARYYQLPQLKDKSA